MPLYNPVASTTPVGVFSVKKYGAAGDGTTDDTAAIQAAINAAFAAGGGQVYFPQAVYAVNGPLVTTVNSVTAWNAQLYIPFNAVANNGIDISFISDYGVDAAVGPYFAGQQAVRQTNRAVLLSNQNFTGAVSNGNEPVVLGGPNPTGGYGSGAAVFNNVNIYWDGVSIVVPNVPDHGIGGVDFRGCAKALGGSYSCLPNAAPGTMTLPSGAGWSFGWAGPNNGNNDKSVLRDATVYAQTYGYLLGEHTFSESLRAISCFHSYGIIGTFNGAGAEHVCTMVNCSAEAIATGGSHMILIGQGAQIRATLDIEDTTLKIVDQSSSTPATGQIDVYGLFTNFATNLPANTSQVKIVNLKQPTGYWSGAPAVPSSTTAVQNTSGRDALVAISGGTFTAITVDGQATGLTAASDGVVVPAGKNIAVTYSIAPSWKWYLFG